MFLGGGIGAAIGMHAYPRMYDRNLFNTAFGAVVFCGAALVMVIALTARPDAKRMNEAAENDSTRPPWNLRKRSAMI